ncbi:putative oxidoreductase [Streptomyces sp. Tu6071]|nr:putative oxidoreductase [Streptomyces sp. Tu6071]
MAGRVVAHRAQEVDLAEGRPEDFAEVVLRVGTLPEHEAGEALLAARADDEVGVGLTAGVEVLGDEVDVDGLGEFLEARALAGGVVEEGADGVGDLLATAVADRDIDQYPGVARGHGFRLFESGARVVGQDVEGADVVDAPAAVGGEGPDGVLDDAEEGDEFGLGAVEVVRGEHPQRHDLDVRLGAPAEELLDLLGARAVALRRGAAGGAGPAAIAVEDEADVLGDLRVVEAPSHPPCVESVHEVAHVHVCQPLRAAGNALRKAPPYRRSRAAPDAGSHGPHVLFAHVRQRFLPGGGRPLRHHGVPAHGPQRPAAARRFARPVAQLRRRPLPGLAARDPAARLRPRHHPLRPREQLRPPGGLGGAELRQAPRPGLRPVPGRAGPLDQGGLPDDPGPVRRVGFAQVPAELARRLAAPDGHRLRRHLLLAPLRPRHPAGGDDGRARDRRPAGQGAVRGCLLVLLGADRRGGPHPARAGRSRAHPPALVLDDRAVDREGQPPRHAGDGRDGLHLLRAARAGRAHGQVPGRHPGGFAGHAGQVAGPDDADRGADQEAQRAERDRLRSRPDPRAARAELGPARPPDDLRAHRRLLDPPARRERGGRVGARAHGAGAGADRRADGGVVS